MRLSKFRTFSRFFVMIQLVFCFSFGVAVFTEFVSSPVQAQQQLRVQANSGVNSLGPFARVGKLLVGLFLNVRNFLYIAAAFTLVHTFYEWATKGEINWKTLLYIVVGLVLMASVGYFLETVTGQSSGSNDSFVPQSTIQIN